MSQSQVTACACPGDEPPPAPHPPGWLLADKSLLVEHFGAQINFKVSIISGHEVNYGETVIQTYIVVAGNGTRLDSFYFGFPQADYCYSRTLSLVNRKSDFDIGYAKGNQFVTLYRVFLGDSLNAGSIYMKPLKHIERRAVLHAATRKI